MARDVTPRDITPASGLPAQPPPAVSGVYGSPPPGGAVPYSRLPGELARQLRDEHKISLDEVNFTAACPQCGADADWTESRKDTEPGFHIHIGCATCRRDARRRLRPA